jgi:hypothetical protein
MEEAGVLAVAPRHVDAAIVPMEGADGPPPPGFDPMLALRVLVTRWTIPISA